MTAAAERQPFDAKVDRLLQLVVHSLYSQREIFLRELISNASDACERLRFAALEQPELVGDDTNLRITIRVDRKKSTLSVIDNGIGMDRDELVQNLGTIAQSGTASFIEELSGDQARDTSLIGQFGVGFYSAFMVADRVEVRSRRAGADTGWRWESDGRTGFLVAEDREAPERGTSILLQLRKDAREFLEASRLREIVRRYSDHIPQPIELGDGAGAMQVNEASALWTRPKREITEDQYREFYHHVGGLFDDPSLTVHVRAEGKLSYTALLFVPSQRPFDLLSHDFRPQVRLYVRRVFITDDCDELLPPYLRFLRGIVDSDDLPLNVSRESLQANPLLKRIRNGVVRQVLRELKRQSERAPEQYAEFWKQFGPVMKEGLYLDPDERPNLLELARFESTRTEGLTSLAEYVGRMPEGQEAIYYLAGNDLEAMRQSAQLEAFQARGIEVLLMPDPIDELWVPLVSAYAEKPFRSVTRGTVDLDGIGASEAGPPTESGGVDAVVAALKRVLGTEVKDVRASGRLTESAVCLVADDTDPDIGLERMLRDHGRLQAQLPRVLEVNPSHPVIHQLDVLAAAGGEETLLDEAAHLLLDQARIAEGYTVADPGLFARRLLAVMERSLSPSQERHDDAGAAEGTSDGPTAS